MKRILIIEDDPEIIKLLELHLSDVSYETTMAMDGDEGLQLALQNDYELILLDLTLPSLDGVEVCRRLRATKNTPVIMLTAKSEEIDRVLGLEIGADDYMTKPFSIRELLARIKAVLRRTNDTGKKQEDTSIISAEGLTIDIDKRKVVVDDYKIELSPKEFELLVLMASNPGRNYTRTELLNMIWGYNFEGYEHTVNSHINRLRAKIESDMANPTYILTTWGVGYKFNEEIMAL
ncbi:MAG: response regulator transcription factor [Maribacter dokdonensis]|uniref:Phosphate regulon transcriptional regulatory protein PhoB n=2 Tax=Maribacter dokdonensis TaxID=320912 RepID=A0A1H4RYK8_9FLAO|nr:MULTISPECIES: response regulator transcription factor [Maribacter]HAF75766.1 DNA-binding response regulator [Maribacter sp.]KSA13619.1 Two component transcriptional regulator, winged helix family [Maribacter dokdonensis DSW-8]MDP2527474.1 response regulator transcription factor [Maribacter dokdonensis]PHN92140.1 DNA-binding response regulator [Maribacter sp. 6B07]CAG2532455.1 DNA-binding response regulator [Maribacter dokdonensis]|tara:strand:- start:7404 stop:8105 length:702 start_codon:yes stop_codon:yes gene_type:complete